jgi:hypothetical protein
MNERLVDRHEERNEQNHLSDLNCHGHDVGPIDPVQSRAKKFFVVEHA